MRVDRFLTLCVLTSLPLSACSEARRSERAAPDFQGTKGAAETTTTPASATELAADLDSRIPALLEETGVPGLAVAVVEGGETVYEGAFGMADRDSGAPVTRDTVSNRTGRFEVWVVPFSHADNDGRQVSTGGGMWPLWNPKPEGGQELFYVGTEGMMAVAVDTEPALTPGPPRVLFDTTGYGTPPTVGANRRVDVSPDGTRFLMFKQDPAFANNVPDLVLIQNWFDELQRLVPSP